MNRSPVILLALLALAGMVPAQCPTQTVATSNTGTTGSNGCMFDIVNMSSYGLTVTGFDQAWYGAYTTPVAIYTKTGSWFGFDNNAAAWTLVGTSAPISVTGTGYRRVPLALSVNIPAGATQGFYITSTNGSYVRETYGLSQLLTTIGSDANLEVRAGYGKSYPFGQSFGVYTDGRPWNGRVTYRVNTPGFQTNSAQASLDVDGAQGGNCSGGATSTKCVGLPMNVHFGGNSLLGNGWDVLLSLAPLVTLGGGALATTNGQIVNINMADPSTSFLFGLSFPPFPAPFGIASPATVTVGMPFVPVVSAQMAVLDVSHPDGFRLSQAFELHGLVSWPGPIPGPAGDNEMMEFTAGQAYGTCSFLAPALPLYGVLQNNYWVTTNGRITWPAGDISSSPAIPTTTAFLGCWADFSTGFGNIIVSYTGTTFTVAFNGVGYYGQYGTASTFTMAIDSVTGVITLSGLTGIATWTGAMVIGASPTNGTNPGAAAFGPGSSGAAAAATDAIYASGIAGAGLAGGANTIVLTPNGAGNYTWVSF